jgi:hypothetical protein
MLLTSSILRNCCASVHTTMKERNIAGQAMSSFDNELVHSLISLFMLLDLVLRP